MTKSYRAAFRISTLLSGMIFLAFIVFGINSAFSGPPIGTFYYPPGNEPPGPPPNYNQVDTTYFLGTPVLPLPPPDSGGAYIWVDSTGWNIANHIYSKGNSLEQFHGSILAILDSPPTPGVNVFANGFELFGDPNVNLCVCYLQNDRWGWYQWSEHLYEIWWDVCTREWRQGSGDPNDFMVIKIAGCAIDFNIWSSGHGVPFAANQIFLGGNKIPLSSVPGFVDTYPGVFDPYQSQAGNDPSTDPNITIFNILSGSGASYNKYGLITAGQTFPCGKILGQDYGDRFAGTFVYEGNGIQFSSACLYNPCESNNPPVANAPGDTSMFVCALNEICITGFTYSDPDTNLLSINVIGGTLNGDTVCFVPVEGLNTITLIATDECGVSDTAITIVTVNLNDPPVANGPNDTTMSVCDLSQICIPGFTYSDPNNNISSVDVIGGTLDGNQVCFTPGEGANIIKLIVADVCGKADTAITVVTVNLNDPPVANSPNDTSIFVCDLSQICIPGFTYSDPDNNISSVDVVGGTLNGNQVCLTPVEGANTIKLIVTDVCGKADTAITVVTVNLNDPPVADSPNDTTMFVCDLSQICIPGFTYSDPDNNISSVDVVGGTLDGNQVCLTPVEGANTIKLIVTDVCGKADTAITVVTVNLNDPPVASSPNDTTMFVCDLSQICIPGFSYNDPNNNISSVDVIGGTLNGDQVCFTPVEGANTVKLIVADVCGRVDTAVTVVTVNLNDPPVASSPNDTTMFVCDLGQICIPGFTYSDPDNNISSVDVVGGTLNGNQVCLTPVEGANTVKLIVADACGRVDTAVTVVTVNLNDPPVASSPNDTTMFVCDLGQICISGFTYSDPDGNISSVDVIGGTLNGSQVCFTPVIGSNTLTLIVTDSCGDSDTSTTAVNIALNTPPFAVSPADTTVLLCALDQICLPGFEYGDSDNNIVSVNVTGGILNGGTVCLTPVAGNNAITLIVVDACGIADTATSVVTANLNSPPTVSCPGDTAVSFVCQVSQICVGPFATSDTDGNIDSSYIVTVGFSGTFNGTTFCFMPNMRDVYQIKYIGVDQCGKADTCAVSVNVQMTNEPPTVQCPGDTTVVACNLNDICLPGFSFADDDNNIAAIQAAGGTYSNGSICFSPVFGQNIISLTVTDSCGLFAACTTVVTVIENGPPNIACINDTTMVVDDLSDICLGGIDYEDPDNNIASVNVVGGVLVGNNICFTPTVGINAIALIVTDTCGAADTCEIKITIGFCEFIPGDANADFEVNGLDITMMVNFFKGGEPLPDTCDCRPDLAIYPFFGAGDTNGDCAFNGLDVTYLYSYLIYLVDEIRYCPSCPPTGGWIASEGQGHVPGVMTKFNEGKGTD